jgi:carbon-monoxide dehydrogenase large subunit
MSTVVGRYVGQSVKRREDPRLLTGHGRYVDDVQIPGTLHLAFVRSNIARGRILSIDVSEALNIEGVEAIYTGADLNPLCGPIWSSMTGPRIEMGGQTVYPPANVLAETDVRYVGDPIAIVLATSRYIAEDAAELVVVDIEASPAVVDMREALKNEILVHPESGSNITAEMPKQTIEQIEALFASAPHVVTRRFVGARASNVPMEPRGLQVTYDRFRGEMEIRAATQRMCDSGIPVIRAA